MSSGPSTFGIMMTSSLSPTSVTAAIMSSRCHGESSALTRVHSWVSPGSHARATSSSPSRAFSLSLAGMPSSRLARSTSTLGAISGTFATIFSFEGGKKWITRAGRAGISRTGSGAPTASGRTKSLGERITGPLGSGAGSGVGDHAPGDDLQAQRLVGALEDRQHAGVDEVAADVVLLGVAHAAVDLHGLAGDPLGRLADVGLHLGRLEAALALGHLAGHGVGGLTAGLDRDGHAGQLDLRELEVGDGLAEHHSVLGVLHGCLVGGLHDAHRPGCGLEPAVLEAGHLQVEAPADALLAADQVLVGHEPRVEGDLVGVHAPVADRVDRPALHAAAAGRAAVGAGLLLEHEAVALAAGLGD